MTYIFDALTIVFREANACERSWSLSASETEERVLAFCDPSEVTAKHLARAARDLGIGDEMLSAWAKAMPGADALGIALRCDRQSVRLYTQYWTALVARVESGDKRAYPLYRGFKALQGGAVRQDDYLCLPMAAPEAFWPLMAQSFGAFGLDESDGQKVFADLGASTAIFTLTDGAARRSWLTTVRRAQIDRDALAEWLHPLSARPEGAEILKAARATDLVHVAGGQDKLKGVFLTLYFESDADTVIERLDLSAS